MSRYSRRLSSHYVLTPQGLIPGAILSFDKSGVLMGIDTPESVDREAGVEFFSGLLVPTLVDAAPSRDCRANPPANSPANHRSTEAGGYILSKRYSEGVFAAVTAAGAAVEVAEAVGEMAAGEEVADVESAVGTAVAGRTYILCPEPGLCFSRSEEPLAGLLESGVNIAIGTSRAMPGEGAGGYIPMIDMLKQITGVPLAELFTWATLGGAIALGIDGRMGSFSSGKRPGATLITGIDWERGVLLPGAVSRRLF